MATRTRTSFQKRQKELARVEKQRDKAAKRLQRKLEGPRPDESDEILLDANGVPIYPNGIEGGIAEDGAEENGEPHDEPTAQSAQGAPSSRQEESH